MKEKIKEKKGKNTKQRLEQHNQTTNTCITTFIYQYQYKYPFLWLYGAVHVNTTHTHTHTRPGVSLHAYRYNPLPAAVALGSNVANNDAQASRGLFNVLQGQRFKMYAGT